MIDPMVLHEKGLVYCQPHFLDASVCLDLVRYLELQKTVQSSTYFESQGHQSHPFRSSREVVVARNWYELIQHKLQSQKESMSQYFGRELASLEPLQFLKYEQGDYFKVHNDRNQERVGSGGIHTREVSILIYLNSYLRPHESATADMILPYTGGELVFYFDFSRKRRGFPLATQSGMMLAFNPDTLHEVKAVLQGVRYAVVSWFHGPHANFSSNQL